MKILVTGVSGFIGSNIASRLISEGYTVYGCGRSELYQNHKRYLKCDLLKEMPDIKVDMIIHMAALSPSESADFNDYYNSNVLITSNIIKYAKKYNIKRIIYTGTVSSYGKVENILKENSPHNESGDYGLTKYVAEQMIRNSKIPYYILILPGVVGKGCRSSWITKTAEELYFNRDLIYYNGQGLFNNILEVGDLCQFIVSLLKRNIDRSETFLLGCKEIMKVGDVVMYLKKHLSSKSELIESEENKYSFYLDINKALSSGFYSKPIKEILNIVCNEVLNLN